MTAIELEHKIDDLSGKMDAILALLGQGTIQPAPCRHTLYSWLDEWRETYKRPALKPSSFVSISTCISKHIKGNLPDMPLNFVTALDVQKAMNRIPTTRMRKYAYDTLGAALKQAYKLRIIHDDIMTMTDKVTHKREQGKALTLEQQAAFLKAISGNKLKPLYLFYLLTGCRKAEALVVKWSDIDKDAKRIFIGGTKTESAERYIPLFPDLEKLIATLPRKGDRLFPYSDNLVKCNFRRLQAIQHFPFSIHSLRHTFATRCLESGIPHNVFSKWLGHAQVSTTLNIYAHVQTIFEKEEATRFDPKFSL